jgi:uncharacterized cupredoxin-like copper-binding protein
MRRILAVVALLAIVLVGCGDDTNDTPGGEAASDTSASAPATTEAAPEPFAFDVTSVDFGYELPTAEVPAGPMLVTQTNEGDEAHQVTFIRLEDGQTPDQLLDLITTEGDDALDPVNWAGGPNSIPPGETNTALVSLEGGEYVAYCFIPDHAQQGMIEPFTVSGDSVAPAVAEATETVGLEEFSFDLPDDFTGQGTIAVTNNGVQGHEMTIVQGEDQLPAGGVTVIAPGQTAYVDLALPPDDYTLLCFVLDPASGQLHGQLGMTEPFTIT